MKEYYLKDLFIVKSSIHNFNQYFICEYDKKNNKYIEIFTGLKMQIKDNSNVELMTNYSKHFFIIEEAHKENLESLFLWYMLINFSDDLISYELNSRPNINKQDIFTNILDRNIKHVSIKKYYINNLFLICVNDRNNYICVYDKTNFEYINIFTNTIIDKTKITKVISLNEYCNISLSKRKVSLFTLLEIYNIINYLAFLTKYQDVNFSFESQKKEIYKKLTKK